MNVSAIIVTRGDVDLQPVLDSLPREWEQVVWDNGKGIVMVGGCDAMRMAVAGHFEPTDECRVPDLSVYGRYAAIEFATWDMIYVQDDDVIVSKPDAILDNWIASRDACAEEQFDPNFLWHASPEDIRAIGRGEHIACNMPQEFRHEFYVEHALVGFGAVFARETPKRAIADWYAGAKEEGANGRWAEIARTCDIIVTGLSPRVLVDVPKTNLSWAESDNRMYRQPEHQAERAWMLEQTMRVKGAR